MPPFESPFPLPSCVDHYCWLYLSIAVAVPSQARMQLLQGDLGTRSTRCDTC